MSKKQPTPSALAVLEYAMNFAEYCKSYDQMMISLQKKYQNLFKAALAGVDEALTFKTAVGAAVITNGGSIFYAGNIENLSRCLDDHAEKRAITAALSECIKPADIKALAMIKDGENTRTTSPASLGCAMCRQYMWENTNPDLLVLKFDPDGKLDHFAPLHIIYPFPWPPEIPQRIKNPSH